MRLLRLIVPLVATVPLVAGVAHASSRASGGDPYFPRQGNSGYDVTAYGLALGYLPRSHHLAGRAHIAARATRRLQRFDLDLRRNLRVSAVSVNGRPAGFSQPAAQVQELVVRPRAPLAAGHRFRTVVRYAGIARPTTDPDGSPDGIMPTRDGAFVVNQPQGAPTWFPVDDTPRDKARYAISVTLPRGLAAISNGYLHAHRTHGNRTTWSWRLDRPVSSYLVTATMGQFRIWRGRTPAGVPYLIAVDPAEYAKARPVLAKLPRVLDYFARVYGRYPFGHAGAIVDHVPGLDYDLETATRPVFAHAPDSATLVHELAHQWWGDDVTVRQWHDIWLNEGFAEFSSYLWDEHVGTETTRQHLRERLAAPASDRSEWLPPPGNPGPKGILSDAMYDRGAGAVAALRETVHDDRLFFAILRTWLRSHAYGNATVGQFIAYTERTAHRDLSGFFQQWLFKRGKPST